MSVAQRELPVDAMALARRWRWPVWIGAVCLWLLPGLAMQYTDEVRWDAQDFAVFAGMLAGLTLAWKLALRFAGGVLARLAALAAIGVAFLLLWANLAVGLVGGEHAPVNALWTVLVLVAAASACWVRWQPRAMVKVLLAIALTQALIAAAAYGIVGASALPALVLASVWLLPAGLYAWAAR